MADVLAYVRVNRSSLYREPRLSCLLTPSCNSVYLDEPEIISAHPNNMSRSSSRASKSSSPNQALKRLTQEVSQLHLDPCEAALHLGPSTDSDLFYWEAVLKGPRDTSSPYHGGLWLLSIQAPINYPLAPPKITFKTPICHPNVHFQTGEICLTLLTSEHWAPTYTLSSTITAIQQLLSDPGLDSPLNVDVTNLYREQDTIGAEGLIRFWTGEKRWAGEGGAGWISERVPGSGGKLGEAATQGPGF